MDERPEGPGPGVLLGGGLAMVACCVGLTLLATGALSGVGAWLFDGGLTWLVLATVLGAGAVYLWRRPKSVEADANPAAPARRADAEPGSTDPK